MAKLSKEEFIKRYIKKLKSLHASCKSWCETFNTFDHDCEIYGSQKYTPSTCKYYLENAYSNYVNNINYDDFIKEIEEGGNDDKHI